MVTIKGSTTITRSVEDVFDLVADERNEPRYNPQMTAVEKLTPGPIGTGTKWLATIDSRGRPMPMEIEVTDYDRPHRLASTTTMKSMVIRGILTYEPVPTGTMMRWSWDLHPLGALRLLAPVIAAQGRRQESAIWTGLKTYMEGGQATP
jgi:uncharacterized protein YndB with AHSA1/START domain